MRVACCPFDDWQQEGVEQLFCPYRWLNRELAAVAFRWRSEVPLRPVVAWMSSCELGDCPRLHRYSILIVLNRRVSSVRDFSLDGCGDGAC